MYRDIETEASYKHLRLVISSLKGPVCVLGGWAVYFTVNNNYQNQTSRIYLGSRDIDIGFNSIKSFKESASILENKLRFKSVSFRYYKQIHLETGRELSDEEARLLPQHLVFTLYIDPIMPHINKDIRAKLNFAPIDEPLLKHVFKNNKHIREIKAFGKSIILPAPELLLATKINSSIHRDKEHKQIKDLCDIIALCLFSGKPIDRTIKEAISFVSNENLKLFRAMHIAETSSLSSMLGLEAATLNAVFTKIKT